MSGNALSKPVEAIQGEDFEFTITLTNPDGTNYDLTGTSLEKLIMENDDGSKLELTITPAAGLSIPNVLNGQFKATVTGAQSALLKDGQKLDMELEFTQASKVIIIQLKNSLTIHKRLFS